MIIRAMGGAGASQPKYLLVSWGCFYYAPDTMTEFMCFIMFANRFLNKVLNGIKTFYPVREQVSQRCYCFLFC